MIQETITGKLIKEHCSMIDNIIQEAFQEHFGFPLKDVQDKEELERITIEGDLIESFRYRGETFLLWQKGNLDFHIDKAEKKYEVNITTKYKKI